MATDLENEFGTRFRSLRKTAGFSRQELADTLGVKWLTVHRWETGYARPWFRTQIRLADLFGVSIVFLMTGSDEVHDPREVEDG